MLCTGVFELARVAWVFPGQGSQFPGMGKQLYDSYPVAREIFERADRVMGFKFSRVIFQGAADELTLTCNAQPAILIVSVACAMVLKSYGFRPGMTAGLSLGEYSALVVAGSLTLEDAVVLTRKRGKYMQDACPPGKGSMAAITGMAFAEVEAICFESSRHGVVTGANYNCPGQTVISGEKKAVDDACRKARERGGRAIALPVSAAFHCALMEPAALRLERELGRVRVQPPSVPVYTNVTGRRIFTSEEIKQSLAEQVTAPVLWQVAVENMIRDGASLFVEVGPGKALTGFGRRIDPGIPFVQFGSPGDLANLLDFHREA
ncbi:MAG TPA: ACP S-malonyltransferase [Firmicutes bacterium]|nr:ACP S-malonyltransferase [Candidatus Fermentithermobacillaceae bacterium]